MKGILIDQFVTVRLGDDSEVREQLIHSQKYDEIKISEVTKPRAKEGEVVAQIAAAGVNFVDLLYVG
jgi:hypothetical protein